MKKTFYIVAFKLLLTALAFYLISKRITINPFSYFTKESIHYFFYALLITPGLILVQALRWKRIASIFDIHFSYRHCLISVWAGHFINNVLPTATAGDLLRSFSIKRAQQANKWSWLGAFLAEKYSAATSALMIACFIVILTPAGNFLPSLLVIFICTLLISLLVLPLLITNLFANAAITQSSRIVSTIYRLNKHLSHALLKKEGRLAFIDSTLVNLAMCFIFYTIAIGVGAPITLTHSLLVVPLFTILAALPISYAGWGVRELSCVELLQFCGVSADKAIVVSILYGLVLLLSCLPGLLAVYPFINRHKLVQPQVR